ncbi:MAG: hypothetical protein ACKPJD_22875 [Planctomycetaceae bacterium]
MFFEYEYEYRPPGRTEYEYEEGGGGSREAAKSRRETHEGRCQLSVIRQ